MRVLVLGDYASSIHEYLSEIRSIDTFSTQDKILLDEIDSTFDLVVSYGYRHLIRPSVLSKLNCTIVNLHISYLPFNRGAHPNVWSWIEGSPSGVSIHLIDEGIDTGPIIERKFVDIDTKTNTLKSSYRVLQQEVESLFKKHLNGLLENQFTAEKQTQEGTIHKTSQLDEISSLLTHGWDTVLESLQTNNKKLRMKKGFPLSGCFHKTS